ncbi:MAG: sugar phosphate isomerase/epimerase [Clostridia bacterium]|nr:sugar phosphate isomerase/epimerase [Clostridia bacterium]
MKISTALEHAVKIDGVSYRESARMMRQAGFDGVDFSLCRHQTEPEKQLAPEWMEDVNQRAQALKAEGLEIAQCHLPYIGNHIERPGDGGYRDYEAFALPGLLRALEACGEIGCRVAVIHPYFDPMSAQATKDGNLRLIEKLMPSLEKYGVRLALENIWGTNYSDTRTSRAEDIMPLIEAAGSDCVGACIDTGHANIFSLDIAQMARIYGKKLFALHVNGNAGKDEHVIPYSMSGWCERMDFRGFSEALKEIGFEGYYNLEIACGDLPKGLGQPFLNWAAAVARALADLAQ